MPVSSGLGKSSTNIIIGFVLVVFLLVVSLVSTYYVAPLTGRYLSPSFLFFISRILFWLSLAIIYIYVVKVEKQPLLLWPEKTYGIGFYLLSILIILLCVIAGAVVVGLTLHYLGLMTKSNAIQTILGFSTPLKLFIVITAAVTEEIIFRGYLMPRLQLFFKNKHWPIIISALVFGLGHVRYGTVINIVVPVLIGFISAWHYQKYRNIKILIICHFIIDFTSLILIHH